jgi:hypothetical protein
MTAADAGAVLPAVIKDLGLAEPAQNR